MAIPIHSEDKLIGKLQTSITSSLQDGIKIAFIDRLSGEARTPVSTTRLFVIDKGTEATPNQNYEVVYAVIGHSTTLGVTTLANGVIRGLAYSDTSLASVSANNVLPLPVGPINKMLLFDNSTSSFF